MTQTNTISKTDVRTLCTSFTDDIVMEETHSTSSYAKELLERGLQTIPDIGKYLKTIEKNLKGMEDEDGANEIKDGWKQFFSKMAHKYNLDARTIEMDYEAWVEWALKYVS